MTHRRTLLFVFSFLFLLVILILVSVMTSRSFSTEKRSKAAGSVVFSQRDYEQWFYDEGKPLLVTPLQTMGTISANKLYYLWFDKQNNKHDFTGPQAGGKTTTAAYSAPTTRGIVSLWGTQLQFATVGSTVCLVRSSSPQTCVASLASLSDERVSVMREFHDLLTQSFAYYAPGGAYWKWYMAPNYGVATPSYTYWRTRQFGPVLESFSQIYPYLYSSSLKKQVEERIFTPYSQYLKSQIGSYYCGVWSDYAAGDCMTAQFLVRGLAELITLSKHHQLMLPALQTDIPTLEQKTTSVLSQIITVNDTWLELPGYNYNGQAQYMTTLGIQSSFNSAVSKQYLEKSHTKIYGRIFSQTMKWQWDQANHIAQNSKTQSYICGYQLGFGSWPHNPPNYYTCAQWLKNPSYLSQYTAYHWLIIEGLRHWSTLLKQFSLYPRDRQFLQDVFPATISWIYQMSKDNGCVWVGWNIPFETNKSCTAQLYGIKGLATALLALDNPSEHFPYYQNYPVDDNGRPLSQKTLTFPMLITRMRNIWTSIKKPDTVANPDMTVQECGLLPQLSFTKNIHIYSPAYAPPTGHLPSFTPTPTAKPTVSPTPAGKKGDFNKDGKVDIFDYNLLVANFGKTNAAYNLTGDNTIDIYDYNMFVSVFGK